MSQAGFEPAAHVCQKLPLVRASSSTGPMEGFTLRETAGDYGASITTATTRVVDYLGICRQRRNHVDAVSSTVNRRLSVLPTTPLRQFLLSETVCCMWCGVTAYFKWWCFGKLPSALTQGCGDVPGVHWYPYWALFWIMSLVDEQPFVYLLLQAIVIFQEEILGN